MATLPKGTYVVRNPKYATPDNPSGIVYRTEQKASSGGGFVDVSSSSGKIVGQQTKYGTGTGTQSPTYSEEQKLQQALQSGTAGDVLTAGRELTAKGGSALISVPEQPTNPIKKPTAAPVTKDAAQILYERNFPTKTPEFALGKSPIQTKEGFYYEVRGIPAYSLRERQNIQEEVYVKRGDSFESTGYTTNISRPRTRPLSTVQPTSEVFGDVLPYYSLEKASGVSLMPKTEFVEKTLSNPIVLGLATFGGETIKGGGEFLGSVGRGATEITAKIGDISPIKFGTGVSETGQQLYQRERYGSTTDVLSAASVPIILATGTTGKFVQLGFGGVGVYSGIQTIKQNPTNPVAITRGAATIGLSAWIGFKPSAEFSSQLLNIRKFTREDVTLSSLKNLGEATPEVYRARQFLKEEGITARTFDVGTGTIAYASYAPKIKFEVFEVVDKQTGKISNTLVPIGYESRQPITIVYDVFKGSNYQIVNGRAVPTNVELIGQEAYTTFKSAVPRTEAKITKFGLTFEPSGNIPLIEVSQYPFKSQKITVLSGTRGVLDTTTLATGAESLIALQKRPFFDVNVITREDFSLAKVKAEADILAAGRPLSTRNVDLQVSQATLGEFNKLSSGRNVFTNIVPTSTGTILFEATPTTTQTTLGSFTPLNIKSLTGYDDLLNVKGININPTNDRGALAGSFRIVGEPDALKGLGEPKFAVSSVSELYSREGLRTQVRTDLKLESTYEVLSAPTKRATKPTTEVFYNPNAKPRIVAADQTTLSGLRMVESSGFSGLKAPNKPFISVKPKGLAVLAIGLKTELNITPTFKQIPLTKTRTQPLSQQKPFYSNIAGFQPITRLETGIGLRQKQLLETKQLLEQQQIFDGGGGGTRGGIGRPPSIPVPSKPKPPVEPPPFIVLPKFKDIKTPKSSTKSKETRLNYGYNPSIEALFLNIRGKPTKLAYTGLGTRPIRVK